MRRSRPPQSLPLLLSLCAAACASTVAPAPAPATTPVASSREFATATAFVQHLATLAAAGDHAGLEAAVDAAFAERLPSGVDLAALFGDVPPGCEVVLSEGPGYSAIAVPPPMVDDSEEAAARTEALIEELSATTEVDASCMIMDEGREQTLMLYTIAVRRDPSGWRALAWRDHRRDY